jgi:hypothetical protein
MTTSTAGSSSAELMVSTRLLVLARSPSKVVISLGAIGEEEDTHFEILYQGLGLA